MDKLKDIECVIHTNNCDILSDGSILCKYGCYTKDGHLIPFINQEEADNYFNENWNAPVSVVNKIIKKHGGIINKI